MIPLPSALRKEGRFNRGSSLRGVRGAGVWGVWGTREAMKAGLWSQRPLRLGSIGIRGAPGSPGRWSYPEDWDLRMLGLWRTWGIQTEQRLLGLLVPHHLGPSGWELGRNPWENEVQTNSFSERESPTVWGSRTGLGGAVLSYLLSPSPWSVPASGHTPGVRASRQETPSACLRPSLQCGHLCLDAGKPHPLTSDGLRVPNGPSAQPPSAGVPEKSLPQP